MTSKQNEQNKINNKVKIFNMQKDWNCLTFYCIFPPMNTILKGA